ncbi:hypothetical protein SDC9_180359 [bioreactor metagenome]|uniref:Uncharacterized protein n=1 Tax=bioreactor metagenome TaxID=1076179 RepID=A0A645H306_9ZZZZ
MHIEAGPDAGGTGFCCHGCGKGLGLCFQGLGGLHQHQPALRGAQGCPGREGRLSGFHGTHGVGCRGGRGARGDRSVQRVSALESGAIAGLCGLTADEHALFNHLRFLHYQGRVTAVTACCCKLKKWELVSLHKACVTGLVSTFCGVSPDTGVCEIVGKALARCCAQCAQTV